MRRPASSNNEPAAKARPSGARHGGDRVPAFWIYGAHATRAAVGNPERRCRRLLAVAEAARLFEDPGSAGAGRRPSLEIVSRRTLDETVGADARHQGVAVLVEPLPATSLEAVLAAVPLRPLVVLDQVTDPRNVGAVLRAAAAFSAAAVIVQDRHAPPETGAMAKAASGALDSVPLVRVVNIARSLRALQLAGYRSIGFTADAPEALAEIDPTPPVALVLGSEGSGLRRLVREHCDLLARIPIAAAVDSLNVATAAAIALYVCATHQA
jgi:23S rRNA (guanosine2251-2'-O)-methyltransferase